MDPNVMECKVVVSGCGHDGPMGASGVKRLESIGLVEPLKGMHCLDMNKAEDGMYAWKIPSLSGPHEMSHACYFCIDIVKYTREVVPGMVVCVSKACTFCMIFKLTRIRRS
jgi:thiamine thiazole synthase